jgi:hypothetical protein
LLVLSLSVSLFLELTHTGSFENSSFASAPAFLWTKIQSWEELLYLCNLNRTIWSLIWLHQCKAGGKNGSISRTRRLLTLISMVSLLLTPAKAWKSWQHDSPPLEAEVEDIKPLLARIQRLNSAAGGGLIGTQLMVFFLQRRIQPLQSRASKLLSYSGLTDPSRVSAQDPEKKDLDKRVRSLTTLIAQMEIPACTAAFFNSTHPLPEVCIL